MRPLVPPGMTLSYGTAPGDETMKAMIADADYAIAGQVAVSGDVMRAARKLKLLHKWGVGVDNLDLEAARAVRHQGRSHDRQQRGAGRGVRARSDLAALRGIASAMPN